MEDDNNTACKVYDLMTKTELRKSYEFVEEQRELLLDKVEKLEEELHQKKKILEEKEEYISHLKELCDRYEKEHNTTFQYWKHIIKEDYKSRIEKAVDYIGQYDGNISGYYYSKENKRFLVEENIKDDLLNILNGEDNE